MAQRPSKRKAPVRPAVRRAAPVRKPTVRPAAPIHRNHAKRGRR